MAPVMATSDSQRRALFKRALVASLAVVTLGSSHDVALERATAPRDALPIHPAGRGPRRPPVRGDEFPDGVLALTWDDGPDAETLALAKYLHAAKVSGTFFVVGEWIDGLSMEPGTGADPYGTGYEHMRVLPEVVALGHRLGSHTRNHVLLTEAAMETVTEQLVRSHRDIDPFLTNELRIFRAPGGAWDRSTASATADPFLDDVIGPVHWDMDAKDWDGSLACRTADPTECEPGPVAGTRRVRADVMARRYLAQAQKTRRGILLLHDRVGHVGSRYALDVARVLVPELKAHGFVLAAPVLAFSSVRERIGGTDAQRSGSAVFADVDGDAHADLCREELGAIVCARASLRGDEPTAMRRVAFEAAHPFARVPSGARSIDMADVDGDGRADLCVLVDAEIDCALGRDRSAGAFVRWGQLHDVGGADAPTLRLADVDGDGRADACVETTDGVACMVSTRRAFGPPRLWGQRASIARPGLELADVDGDHRADLCIVTPHGLECALSDGSRFSSASCWSFEGDFEGPSPVRLADLNGDGRADACAATEDGVACALSNGRHLTRASIWSPAHARDIRLADVSGDGRADLCIVDDWRVVCGMAP